VPHGEPTEPHGENTAALFGFFCGLIAVPSAFILIGILFGVLAIVLGRRGLQRPESEGRRGMAWAAIVLGAIGIVLGLVTL
jgi:uncharacterized membrane protein HdeD (DUF308 family)